MKKKILSVVFIVAVITVVSINISRNDKEASLSDFMIENADALASGESGTTDPNELSGYKLVECKNSNDQVTGHKCSNDNVHPDDKCNKKSESGKC